MGKLIIHKNELVSISKDVLLDDSLSLPARGLYSVIIALLDTDTIDDTLQEIFRTNVGTKFAFYELLEHDIIKIKRSDDGKVDYEVR
jgi:flagellar biosynthesis regulator FlbT